DASVFIHTPFGLAAIAKQKKIVWGYETVPQKNLCSRALFWPRCKTLGGSSSVNAMIYIRGAHEDYDGWANEGAHGWGWEKVLPYFKKAEDQERGADDSHGVGGPSSVSNPRHVSPLSQAFIQAGSELQIRLNNDFNGAFQDGVGLYQVTQRNGKRCSTS